MSVHRKPVPPHVLGRPDITFLPHNARRIRDLYERGELVAAQRIILDLIKLAIDGPPFRIVRDGKHRKRLVPR